MFYVGPVLCTEWAYLEVSVRAHQGDVRQYADCERAVQQTVARYGRLDIVVNCAAGNFLATAEELTSNGFRTGPLGHH